MDYLYEIALDLKLDLRFRYACVEESILFPVIDLIELPFEMIRRCF